MEEKKKEIQKEVLEPITKVKSKEIRNYKNWK